MRLIDADKVLGVLRELDAHSFSGTIHIKNAMHLINEQPTVYDVDKVVEQLEELTREECTLHECGIRSEYCRPCIAKKAIEIVKAGGQND